MEYTSPLLSKVCYFESNSFRPNFFVRMLLARATTTRRVDECALSLAELSDIDEGGSVYFKNVSGEVKCLAGPKLLNRL